MSASSTGSAASDTECDGETSSDLLGELGDRIQSLCADLDGLETALDRIGSALKAQEAGVVRLVGRTEAARAWLADADPATALASYEHAVKRVLDRAQAVTLETRTIRLGPTEVSLFGAETITLWDLLRGVAEAFIVLRT